MSYEHVCGNLMWYIGIGLVSGVILYGLYRLDDEFMVCDKSKLWHSWCIWSTVTGVMLYGHMEKSCGVEVTGYWLLAVYFVLCGVMDGELKLVCDIFHYIGLLGGCLLLVQKAPAEELLVSLLLFALLQGILFRRMYGRADICAFVICALYLTAEGHDMEGLLFHMVVTFLLLGIVQVVRRNISRRGNLKQPVALFPYIIVGFFMII